MTAERVYTVDTYTRANGHGLTHASHREHPTSNAQAHHLDRLATLWRVECNYTVTMPAPGTYLAHDHADALRGAAVARHTGTANAAAPIAPHDLERLAATATRPHRQETP